MSRTVPIADWIKRVADDERRRDEARATESETAARKAELIRGNGRRLVDELCAAVTRDVAAFRAEFTLAAGMPPREDRIEMLFTDNHNGTLQIKQRRTGQAFATADALSEFLPAPVPRRPR